MSDESTSMAVSVDSVAFRSLNSLINSLASSRTFDSKSGSSFRNVSMSLCICALVDFFVVSIPRISQMVVRCSFRLTGWVFNNDMIVGAMILTRLPFHFVPL